MLRDKTVILGVTGSIAAYKIANLASMLVKQHAKVHVIMTKNATNFITPITFETLTGTKCLVDTFDREFDFKVEHVSLAKEADIMLVAPASANIIAKMAHGIADDMLSTTALAFRKEIIVSPAMNTNMFENPIVQDNINKLKEYGMTIVEPAVGMLACKDVGIGKMPEPEVLMEYILKGVAFEKDLAGKKVLVTAGATMEAIDPVRFISNHSTGKMGYAIARRAMQRGADVTLVTGKTALNKPMFMNVVDVISAKDMFDEVVNRAAEQDIIIKAAAVADYTPANVCNEKIKKQDGSMCIQLNRTNDILAHLGEMKAKKVHKHKIVDVDVVKTEDKKEIEEYISDADLERFLQPIKETTDGNVKVVEYEKVRIKTLVDNENTSETKEETFVIDDNEKFPFICGFSMETSNVIENSKDKLHRKNADMIVANSLKEEGAGFGTDTNIVTIITEADVKELPIMSKEEVAGKILDEIAERI